MRDPFSPDGGIQSSHVTDYCPIDVWYERRLSLPKCELGPLRSCPASPSHSHDLGRRAYLSSDALHQRSDSRYASRSRNSLGVRLETRSFGITDTFCGRRFSISACLRRICWPSDVPYSVAMESGKVFSGMIVGDDAEHLGQFSTIHAASDRRKIRSNLPAASINRVALEATRSERVEKRSTSGSDVAAFLSLANPVVGCCRSCRRFGQEVSWHLSFQSSRRKREQF